MNGRLSFPYRKQNFLDFPLRRLLANALIQPHFDYACSAWYPLINKRLTKKIQLESICFTLNVIHAIHSFITRRVSRSVSVYILAFG